MFMGLWAAVTTFLVPLPLLLLLSFGMTAQLPCSCSRSSTRRGEPWRVPLDLSCPQPEQRLHWKLCGHPERRQQQQRKRHKEGRHRRPQAQEHPAE